MCTHICSSELRSSEMPNAAQISAFEDADDLFFVGVACARTALISSKAVRKTCVPNPGISKTKVAKCMPLFLFMPTRGLHAATSMAMGDLGGRSLGEGDLGGRHGPSLGVGALGGRHELALLSIRRFCNFVPCFVINQEIPCFYTSALFPDSGHPSASWVSKEGDLASYQGISLFVKRSNP